MTLRLLRLLGFALALACAAPAAACSVEDSYRVPTNLQLAAEADVILIGRIESGPTDMSGPDAMLTVTPLELLKGALPPGKPLALPGVIAPPRFAVLSNPLELEQAHPLAYIGACTRYMFVRGATVLFFLRPADKALKAEDMPPTMRGTLIPAGGPFSRWAEDVLSAESPWVRATRIYVAAAALPPDGRTAMLTAERDRLRAAGDQESAVVADDIDRQLAGPAKPWNQLMAEELKKMKRRGRDPLDGLGDD